VKPPLRTKSVGTKVSEAEFALLEERARAAGLTLSEWVREALLAGPVELEAGEVVLAEVLALRSLFLNLSFRADKGPLTEAEMRGLIERADGVKIERARERLAAARLKTSRTAAEKSLFLPQAQQGVVEAQQRYTTALHQWQAEMLRASSHTEIVNPQ
jgi:hypothetical protein